MDWSYILSLNADDLDDDKKDELYNLVTWYEVDDDDVDLKRAKALINVSQEILKYKGEQVETLLHELEEMALKQSEEEARRQESDLDVRSRKSSFLEFENLEQRYLVLKEKYKKITRNNEKKSAELDKLIKKTKQLEQENRNLQTELKTQTQDVGSESDASESLKDQQRALVETIHNKNKQISDLLRDAEEVENENLLLREKLSKVRDELSIATTEITSMTEILKEKEGVAAENSARIKKLSAEYEALRESKQKLEEQMKTQKIELDTKIDDMNILMEKRDKEIHMLKSRLKDLSVNTSISSLPRDDPDMSSIVGLKNIIAKRDEQLMDLQNQLHIATKEIEKTTDVIKKLKASNDRANTRIQEMVANSNEMKKTLEATYERCQKLQDEVTFSEKTAAAKEEELKELLVRMNETGQVDLVVNLNDLHVLKADNRLKEKHIMSLVKVSNKLEDTCDLLEKENLALREKLGLPDDEQINLISANTKYKKMKKELDVFRNKLSRAEEANINLKAELHKLKQLKIPEPKNYPSNERTDSIDTSKTREDNKALADENEALRKGMHEILNSVNAKKSSSVSEIKSETLEELLRALDVKHISGWYHPAMRLQAELHNLQGINIELRDQLRETKVELKKFVEENTEAAKKEDASVPEVQGNDTKDATENIDHNFGESVKNVLENIILKLGGKETHQDDIDKDVENVLKDILMQKDNFETKLREAEMKLRELEQEHECLITQMKILKTDQPQEQLEQIEQVVKENIFSKRKVNYLQNNISLLQESIESLKRESKKYEIENIKKISELEKSNNVLENKLEILKNTCDASIAPGIFKEVDKNLSDVTIKYRKLLNDIEKQEQESSTQKQMMQESLRMLEDDKLELKDKLIDMKTSAITSKKVERDSLAQKLAESEVNVMTERQRANHTNNLYELVKEQLSKSEERFQEYSKYSEELLKKNLILQEQLKDVENIVCHFVDVSVYEQQQIAKNNTLKEKEQLLARISDLETKINLQKKENDYEKTWNDQKEQELFGLRHQVVDLTATSNERMIIAQLNNDLAQSKQHQDICKKQLDDANDQLNIWKQKYEHAQSKYEDEVNNNQQMVTILNNKVSHLQRLLSMQKLQYLGCVPLCSEERYIKKMRMICKEKQETFSSLYRTRILENEATMNKEKLEIDLNFVKKEKEIMNEGIKEEYDKAMNWMQEKKTLLINELRYKRQAEFKEAQLQHLFERVRLQDEEIAKLDEELLSWHKNLDQNFVRKDPPPAPVLVERPTSARSPVVTKDAEVQLEYAPNESEQMTYLKNELLKVGEESTSKDKTISHLKSRIAEQEMTISLFRKQLGDKQSQITFYERHIMELQNKKEDIQSRGPGGDNLDVGTDMPKSNEDVCVLKTSIQVLQENLKTKDDKIVEYETLLKVDRDKHSLAAATLQEELRNYQTLLNEEKQNTETLKENFHKTKPNKAALEQYVSQVHALERHTSELHTRITSLEAQLQSSREEAVRWRSLANDRLTAMEELRQSLDEQHKNELQIYKTDAEKLKELAKDEKNNLVQLIQKQKTEFSGRVDSDILRLFKEKDNKIHELTIKLRQMKHPDVKRNQPVETSTTSKLSDGETNQQLSKEIELLRKRYEQLLHKERSTNEEIRSLKAQLMKKPNSARSDRTDKGIKDQLQRKIQSLENEIVELKRNLADQIAMNETHRVQASDDFEKWKKMKHWQQSADKLKNKLKERDIELEKLQQTNTGYRLLIERLERDKHNLEQRIKTIKNSSSNVANINEFETLKIENMKLAADLEAMHAKLEMQQRHSGALGAAMLQEKLEAQERKIAILELTAKGTAEVRAELERLQVSVSNLQKSNLRLEAENLDLKLDLERTTKEVPHLQQQIQHLDSYIDILKTENSTKPDSTEVVLETSSAESKKRSELERTVLVLRRVVEKLQVENKRLLSGKRPISDRAVSADKLRRDYNRLKDQYEECVTKMDRMEQELTTAKHALKNIALPRKSDDFALADELSRVREQLESKSSLLDKVKVLLHRAAAKEKSLLQEIAELRNNKTTISPIPELSEGSSSDL